MTIQFLTKPVKVDAPPDQKKRRYDLDKLLLPMVDTPNQWYKIAEKVRGTAAAPYQREYQDFEFTCRMREDFAEIIPPNAKNPQTYLAYDMYVCYRGTDWYKDRQERVKKRAAAMAARGTRSGPPEGTRQEKPVEYPGVTARSVTPSAVAAARQAINASRKTS